MNVLIDYCDVNNSIDGYLFDNTNSLIYLYLTHSTSKFYSKLTTGENEYDYVDTGITTLYEAIKKKDLIEEEHSDLFPRISDQVNLNCSEPTIPDDYFIDVLTKKGISYDDYYLAVCKFFPVSGSASDTNILMEIMFNVEVLFRKYTPANNFNETYDLYINNERLFSLFSLVLTINRIIRTYFNDKIFINEVDSIFKNFSSIFIVYLVLCVIFEIVIFFVLNFGIISDVRKTNKLLMDFMSSLKY